MSKRAPSNPTAGFPLLNWRIGVAMAEAGVRTNRELKKRLSEVGYKTSEATLCRLRKVSLRSIDVELFSALCAVLGTSPNELLAPEGGWRTPARSLLPGTAQRNEPPSQGPAGSPSDIAPLAPSQTTGRSSLLGPRIRAVRPFEKTMK